MTSAASLQAAFLPLHENTPELARYGGEPAQMPSGSVGKCGFLELRFTRDSWNGHPHSKDGGRTLMSHMERRVPFLVQKALYWDESLPDLPCVMIITTTGCVLQGDRLELRIRVDEGARAHVTTQSATKIHMMEANYAAQVQHLEVAAGGYLEYLPDPVIPHRTSRFASDTQLVVDADGMALYAEILQPGRVHHHEDERFGFDLYATTCTLRRPHAASPLFTERMVVEPQRQDVDAVGVMNGFDVFGNVLLAAPPAVAKQVRDSVPPLFTPGLVSGVSALPGECGLAFRVLGHSTEAVRAEVRRFWAAARLACTGEVLPQEFLWR